MFNKNYKNKIRELEKSNEELRKQLNAFENCVTLHVDFINKLLDIPEKGGLVYIANNKIAQYCLVMDHIESLKLYIANNTSYIGYLHYKIYETENYILLEDIQVENKDIGNGTILVEALKTISKARNKTHYRLPITY